MITKPSEIYFKDGIWAWDANASAWIKLEVDASGYLKIVVSDTAGLKASDLNLDGAKDLQVDVKTSALPSGAATSAKQNQLQGWDGAAWRKLPLVWGYSDVYSEIESEDNVGVGNQILTFSVVGAGEVWVVTCFVARSIQDDPSSVRLQARVGGVVVWLKAEAYPVANMTVASECLIVLKEGDYLQVTFVSCLATTDVRANAIGYKMKIAE